MRDIRLPDGTWVTSAISSKNSSQCPDDTCTWVDFGPPTPPGFLPVSVQLQKCERCGYTRGRYLESLDEPDDPPGIMEIDGKKIDPTEVCVIAARFDDVGLTPGVPVCLIPCTHCRAMVHVDSDSLRLLSHGARLMCIACAATHYPNAHAGRDPDTGRDLSVEEILSHPNWVGAYRYRDIKET